MGRRAEQPEEQAGCEVITMVRDAPPGSIVRTRDGILAVKSEHHYPNGNSQCVLLASGEYAHFPQGDDEPVTVVEPPPLDVGEVHLQTLLNAGLNAFAVELLAESWYRDGVREAVGAVAFTVKVRKQSGSTDTVPVRIAVGPGAAVPTEGGR
jgi:hypothetical protein